VQAEVERVIDAGYKEIAITGVHLGSFGRDLDPAASLGELLTDLMRIRDGVLFRVSSLEPMDVPRELLDFAEATASGDGAGGARLAPHFHLPLQHASNRLLERMRRPYTLEQYSALVDSVRRRVPHAAIGSDVIVGFPGETDDDFAVLTSYLEQSPLTHLHVFPYSDRPGTVASSLSGKVHGSIVKSRAERIRQISRQLQNRFREAQRGTIRPALTIEDGTVAMTDNYVRVSIPSGRARNEYVLAAL
jgi:threonylcarbamoyladenosine tRNA methylthiotransferase MtaB